MSFKLTKKTEQIIEYAKICAVEYGYSYVTTPLLLLSILKSKNSMASVILEGTVSIDAIVQFIEKKSNIVEIEGLSPKIQLVLKRAEQIAYQLDMQAIGIDILTVALFQEPSELTKIVSTLKIDSGRIYKEIYESLGFDVNDKGEVLLSKKRQSKTPMLNYLTRNLTELAIKGDLQKAYGRQAEEQRLLQILCRKTKNNPVLVGESGVGKTAIAESVAYWLLSDKVPEMLQGKKLVSLDVGTLVAGTKYRGEFEERIKRLVDELVQQKNIIVFIDEIHMLIGAGGSEGSVDAANILKPALSRGDIQVIGATTFSEYQKYIEKDPALERRFAPVVIEEPSEELAYEMLRDVIPTFESYHKVSISSDVLKNVIYLSKRYIQDRKLPDKAIDVIDEAAAKLKLGLRDSLKGKMPANYETLLLRKQYKKSAAAFQNEKHKSQERTVEEILPALTNEDVASVVSSWTKIPVQELTKKESKKLLNLEKVLSKRVIGQDNAIKAVSRAVRRSRSGIGNAKKPIGSFLFLGPTGVGKTELAKSLAHVLFGREDQLIRVDMSEFMDKHSTSRLIGAPPGYVGFDEGGQLTERVRKNPYAVVLFDELEKAHMDVFNILLQVLDDGYVTDTKGRRIDFTNTVIIMTSNLGVTTLRDDKTVGFSTGKLFDEAHVEKTMREELKKTLKPEFLNRIDDIVVFKSLIGQDIEKIVRLMLNDVAVRLKKFDVMMNVSNNVVKHISHEAFHAEYGARPIRRYIQQCIEDSISELLLSGELNTGQTVKIGLKKKRIICQIVKSKEN